MDLITSDNRFVLDVGDSDNFRSLYSTATFHVGRDNKSVSLALRFLESGSCTSEDAERTAREINLIRDALSIVKPEDAISDIDSPRVKPDFVDDLSPVVTSCANMYYSADGKDLLAELVQMLVYAGIAGASISIA